MTVADEVLNALRASPVGMTDAQLAALLGKRHQHINMTCRNLADHGLVVRDGSAGSVVNQLAADLSAGQVRQPVRAPAASVDDDWAWEGNVQSCVVRHLAGTGWRIISVADTARREQGIDVVAERDGNRLLVEVKGWPSKTYARGERAGQPKPTQPTLQAAHWFASGLTTLTRHGGAPGVRLALALPDKPRYRTLLGEAGWARERLDITAYLVGADWSVQTWGREI